MNDRKKTIRDQAEGHPSDVQPDAQLDAQHDVQLAQVLADFRSTVHSWSAQEYAQAEMLLPARKPSRFLMTPLRLVTGLAMVAFMVAVPWVYQLNRANTPQVASNAHPTPLIQPTTPAQVEAQIPDMQPRGSEQESATISNYSMHIALTSKPAAKMNDEELMTAVDEDVSQSSPDAMLPLAELMSTSTSTTTTQN